MRHVAGICRYFFSRAKSFVEISFAETDGENAVKMVKKRIRVLIMLFIR